MLNMKNFMDAIKYRVTEGSSFGWSCFGPNSYCIDSCPSDVDDMSATIVFDTVTQNVFEIQVFDYAKDRAYRLMNPAFMQAFKDEADRRGVPFDEAYEDVSFIDLDVDEDMIEKLTAIMSGIPYDSRVQISINLPDDMLLEIMKIAHERDITFNTLVEQILQDFINERKGTK